MTINTSSLNHALFISAPISSNTKIGVFLIDTNLASTVFVAMACLISALYVGTLTRVVSTPFSESSFAKAPIIYVFPTPKGPAKYNPFWYSVLFGL